MTSKVAAPANAATVAAPRGLFPGEGCAIRQSGWLEKSEYRPGGTLNAVSQALMFASRKRRFFVLRGSTLFYGESPEVMMDENMQPVLPRCIDAWNLASPDVSVSCPQDAGRFAIVLTNPRHVKRPDVNAERVLPYLLLAPTAQEFNEWVIAFEWATSGRAAALRYLHSAHVAPPVADARCCVLTTVVKTPQCAEMRRSVTGTLVTRDVWTNTTGLPMKAAALTFATAEGASDAASDLQDATSRLFSTYTTAKVLLLGDQLFVDLGSSGTCRFVLLTYPPADGGGAGTMVRFGVEGGDAEDHESVDEAPYQARFLSHTFHQDVAVDDLTGELIDASSVTVTLVVVSWVDGQGAPKQGLLVTEGATATAALPLGRPMFGVTEVESTAHIGMVAESAFHGGTVVHAWDIGFGQRVWDDAAPRPLPADPAALVVTFLAHESDTLKRITSNFCSAADAKTQPTVFTPVTQIAVALPVGFQRLGQVRLVAVDSSAATAVRNGLIDQAGEVVIALDLRVASSQGWFKELLQYASRVVGVERVVVVVIGSTGRPGGIPKSFLHEMQSLASRWIEDSEFSNASMQPLVDMVSERVSSKAAADALGWEAGLDAAAAARLCAACWSATSARELANRFCDIGVVGPYASTLAVDVIELLPEVRAAHASSSPAQHPYETAMLVLALARAGDLRFAAAFARLTMSPQSLRCRAHDLFRALTSPSKSASLTSVDLSVLFQVADVAVGPSLLDACLLVMAGRVSASTVTSVSSTEFSLWCEACWRGDTSPAASMDPTASTLLSLVTLRACVQPSTLTKIRRVLDHANTRRGGADVATEGQSNACAHCRTPFHMLQRNRAECTACRKLVCGNCVVQPSNSAGAGPLCAACYHALTGAEVSPPNLAADWVPDEAVTSCFVCTRPFGFARRRHHCRRCGNVVCANCSPREREVVGYQTPQRVCLKCEAGDAVELTTDWTQAVFHDPSAPTPDDLSLAVSGSRSGAMEGTAQQPVDALEVLRPWLGLEADFEFAFDWRDRYDVAKDDEALVSQPLPPWDEMRQARIEYVVLQPGWLEEDELIEAAIDDSGASDFAPRD